LELAFRHGSIAGAPGDDQAGKFLGRKITMPNIVSSCTGLFLCFALGAASSAQQDNTKRPSPPAKAECKLPGEKNVTVDYSSPRAKGRKVYGELVPYGKVWRAGANDATTFVTDADLVVGGTSVPAGGYTIFTVPNADKWQLVISKKTGEWGTAYPGPGEDLARIDMKVSKLPSPIENFTIAFDQTSSGCTLRMDWETTRASVGVSKK
jgi:Protein of unknown function (DUF2911)